MWKWWCSLTAKDVHNRVLVWTFLFGAAFFMWRFLVGGFWHAVGAMIVYVICGIVVNVVVCDCVVDDKILKARAGRKIVAGESAKTTIDGAAEVVDAVSKGSAKLK